MNNVNLINEESMIIINKNINQKKYKKKTYPLVTIISFIILLSVIIIFVLIKKSKRNIIPIDDYYRDFLPKTSISQDKKITNLEEIFKSRQLYIDDVNLTNEYIHYIRPINETEEENYKKKIYENVKPNQFWKEKRPNQYSFEEYYKLIKEEKLINNFHDLGSTDKPLVSVIISSFNKEKIIMKSIRSIQNQSLKNIEIIIVDDCSTDQSKYIFMNLMETDPRIRVFTHLKNQGCWKSRLDGVLYSRAKYFILFDMEDFYTDNYVLEDAYTLIHSYNLDFIKFSFIQSSSYEEPYSHIMRNGNFPEELETIHYGSCNFNILTYTYGTTWNRLARTNVFIKSLDSVDQYILNAYKNLWEDRWHNTFLYRFGFSYIMINRPGYLYMDNIEGEGRVRPGNSTKLFKLICEFIYLWLFDFELLAKEDDKKSIIFSLRIFNNEENRYMGVNLHLGHLIKVFRPYEYLLNELIKDTYVSNDDKMFVKELLDKYHNKTKNNYF